MPQLIDDLPDRTNKSMRKRGGVREAWWRVRRKEPVDFGSVELVVTTRSLIGHAIQISLDASVVSAESVQLRVFGVPLCAPSQDSLREQPLAPQCDEAGNGLEGEDEGSTNAYASCSTSFAPESTSPRQHQRNPKWVRSYASTIVTSASSKSISSEPGSAFGQSSLIRARAAS